MTLPVNHSKVKHPGVLIREKFLEEKALPLKYLSHVTQIPISSLWNILQGNTRIQPWHAIRFAAVLGSSAEYWLKLQSDYDLMQARQEFKATKLKLKRIES
jgi:addiction module HigA family antidote